jgi:hypothetical protein
MRTEDLGVTAIMAVAAVVGIARSVKNETAYYRPKPSPALVEMIFAPCQAFDTAVGHAVTKQEAVQVGLRTPTLAEPPAVTQSQSVAQDHAAVGVANTPQK